MLAIVKRELLASLVAAQLHRRWGAGRAVPDAFGVRVLRRSSVMPAR